MLGEESSVGRGVYCWGRSLVLGEESSVGEESIFRGGVFCWGSSLL